MEQLERFEEEINKIKERNRRVELDKAWEVSWARRILVFGLTYLVIGLFFLVAGLPKPWLNAIVPAAGFMLSTLTISGAKKIWLRRRKQ